jgi:hypothetical protein
MLKIRAKYFNTFNRICKYNLNGGKPMKDVKDVKGQVSETIATLMTTAFGLIAALAWNEAIKAIIDLYLPSGEGITGLLVYAILITIIAVVATLIIAKVIAKPAVQAVRIVE